MNLKIIVAVIIALLMASCTVTRKTEVTTAKIYTDIQSASLATEPVVSVTYKGFVRINIGDNAPLITGEKSPNKFGVIGVTGKKNEDFTIVVRAECDCTPPPLTFDFNSYLNTLNFKERAVSPIAYLLNTDGEVVAQGQTTNIRAILGLPEKTLKGELPVLLLKGKFPSDAQYKVIVIADNTNSGMKIAEIVKSGNGAGAGGLTGAIIFTALDMLIEMDLIPWPTTPVVAHPTGLIWVQWIKLK